jgi:hydroxymethylbilane synthase
VALRIGTRASPLALWQAQTVAVLLDSHGVQSELVNITTSGDRLQQAPLSEVGGKRLFVKEIEEALLRGDIDLAVHSAKDMSAVLPDGLEIAATLPREDPRDALILPAEVAASEFDNAVARLGEEPKIGTGSVRRTAQLARMFPGATFLPIRGNVDTRLRKLDAGGYDALVLAAAGVIRLGLAQRITARIPVDRCVPAPGQGIVAVETRVDDDRARQAVRAIHDSAAGVALDAERALVEALGGGCQLPLGALAVADGSDLHVRAVVAAPDGSRVIAASTKGAISEAASLGRRAAEVLIKDGALDILDAIRRAESSPRL